MDVASGIDTDDMFSILAASLKHPDDEAKHHAKRHAALAHADAAGV